MPGCRSSHRETEHPRNHPAQGEQHLLGQPNLLRECTCLLPSSRRRSTSLRCSCFFAPVLECLTFFLLPACGIQARQARSGDAESFKPTHRYESVGVLTPRTHFCFVAPKLSMPPKLQATGEPVDEESRIVHKLVRSRK